MKTGITDEILWLEFKLQKISHFHIIYLEFRYELGICIVHDVNLTSNLEEQILTELEH